MIFVTTLVISNVVTAKTIATGIPLFGGIILPGAALCYAITFLMTDIIGQIWGKDEANICVKWGFIGQIIATTLIILTQFLPASDPQMQIHYEAMLGQNWVFVVGSLTAYLISQKWDVWVFHKLKGAYEKKHGNCQKGRWIWNNASTVTSQILDTVIFVGISFGLGFGWLFDPAMRPTLFGMMIGQYLIKAVLALLDTPFFYLFTRKSGKDL